MSVVEQYLSQLNTRKRRWRRAVWILTALSLVVASVTVWNLRMTGVTIANGASCGFEEHQHTADCTQEGRVTCGYEEHIHVVDCYSDPKADTETSELWKETLPTQYYLSWAENLASVARSQVGYTESVRNYVIAADGTTRQGITRYGQWYGNPYGDWSAMFVAFCLEYAGIPQAYIPRSAGVQTTMQLYESKGILSPPDSHISAIGNILFVDTDGNGNADKLLIVTAATKEQLLAIGGDWEQSVAEVTLSTDDPRIMGYTNVGAQQPEFSYTAQNTLFGSGSDLVGSFLTSSGKNAWQIVSGGYVGRDEIHKSGNESVLIQKNVVPTAIENEFLVYLSIDKKLSWNTVFEYGTYWASSSNSGSVGSTTSLSGNAEALSDVPTGSANTSFYMVIQLWNDSKTKLLSESDVIMRYTGKTMKNGRILLQLPDTNKALVVAKISDFQGTTADNPVYIQLTESMVGTDKGPGFEKFSVTDTVLDSVTDVMGDNIEFVEILAGDYTATPQYQDGVLTWYPKSIAADVGTGSGEMWQRNAAQLIYKIRLKNHKSCLECLDTTCSLAGCDHVYPISNSAVLKYHASNETSNIKSMSFQTPYVRGLLYDIHFTKVDEDFGFPLLGAVFRLTKENDISFVPIKVVSSESGAVSFENLPPGTYTLTETKAPTGYEITFGDARNSIEIVLSYTDNPSLLMPDAYAPSHTENLMYMGDGGGEWKVTNKSTKAFVELPSTGGNGVYLYILCGLTLVIGPFVYAFSLRRKRERGSTQ